MLTAALARPCPELVQAESPPESPGFSTSEDGGGMRVFTVDRDGAAVPDAGVVVRSADGVEVRGRTDAEGQWLLTRVPPGLYTVEADHGARVQGANVMTGGTLRVRVLAPPSGAPPTPEPPDPSTWIRYERTACLGPCPSFAVIVDREGAVTLGSRRNVLSSQARARLREELACAASLPSYAADTRTDHSWTRLYVWEQDGSSWSWVWYSGDARAPYDELSRFRRRLERALHVSPGR